MNTKNKAFTLIEVLISSVLIALLSGIIIIAINPVGQIRAAKEAGYESDMKEILSAVTQYAAENGGDYPSTMIGPPFSFTEITDSITNFCSDLVPDYLPRIPVRDDNGYFNDCNDYKTGYQIRLSHDFRLSLRDTLGNDQTIYTITQ
jgi:prepilin-type N-terminal cleavage/methylation domain-containing protein